MLMYSSKTAVSATFPKRAAMSKKLHRKRLRQHSMLTEFSRTALQTRDFNVVLQRATALCAQGLDAPFATAMEFVADDQPLVVHAGFGWPARSIENASFAAGTGSVAGYAFRTGQPVIANHFPSEGRFQFPRLLKDHGVKRSISVPIKRGGRGGGFFGVLEVDSPDTAPFDQADAEFLAEFAELVGIAVERHQADTRLEQALGDQAMLTREMSHRVKNSLASVAAMLRVQSRSTQANEVSLALEDAGSRVAAIAQIHDQLSHSSQIGCIDLAIFIAEFCGKLQGAAAPNVLHCRADPIRVSADHAVPLGILINELVTNAVKHAYPGGNGPIDIRACERNGYLHLDVSDHGVGLPADFDIDRPRTSLGFRMIKGMVRQFRGRLTVGSNQPTGTHFRFELPMLLNPERRPEALAVGSTS